MGEPVRIFVVRRKDDHKKYMTPQRDWTEFFMLAAVMPKHQADAYAVPEEGELFEIILSDFKVSPPKFSTVEIPVRNPQPRSTRALRGKKKR